MPYINSTYTNDQVVNTSQYSTHSMSNTYRPHAVQQEDILITKCYVQYSAIASIYIIILCVYGRSREKIFQEFPNPLIPGKVGLASHKCNLTPELYTHTRSIHLLLCNRLMLYAIHARGILYAVNMHVQTSTSYANLTPDIYVCTVQQYSCYI